MFLRRIRLQNIRCFEDVEINFAEPNQNGGRKWTVLLGENGTGKTTLLRSIGLILAGPDSAVEFVENPDDWIKTGAAKGRISAEIEFGEHIVKDLEIVFRKGVSKSEFISDYFASSSIFHLNRKGELPVFGYGSGRQLPSKSDRGFEMRRPIRHETNIASLMERGHQLRSIEAWAKDIDYMTNGLGLDTVKTVLSEFLPELTFSHIDKLSGRIIFESPDGPVALDQLSDGYQNVVAWVGDLLFYITHRRVERTDQWQRQDPLSIAGILLVDEIDLHLHPKWQRRLLDFLDTKMPNMQLVVTTHSVVTAQQTPDESLFYCIRQDGKSPAIHQYAADPRKLLLGQLLASEAFGNLSDESLALETDKTQFRSLSLKSDKSDKDRRHLEAISNRIGDLPNDPREDIRVTKKQRELMDAMMKRLGD